MKKVVFDLENDRYASIKTFLLLIECTFFCNWKTLYYLFYLSY